MAWQSDEIQPYSSSPADDIFKIQNDLSVIKAILEGGSDAEVAMALAKLADIGSMAGTYTSNATSLTLTTSNIGKAGVFYGPAAAAWTLPAAPAYGSYGKSINIMNRGSAAVTLSRSGTDVMYIDGDSATSVVIYPGESIALISEAGCWIVLSFTKNPAQRGVLIGVPAWASAGQQNPLTSTGILDVYSEAAFQPVVKGTTTAGTFTYASGSYDIGTRSARVVRIGSLIYFYAAVQWTGHTGTGNIRVELGAFVSGDSSLNVNAIRFDSQPPVSAVLFPGGSYSSTPQVAFLEPNLTPSAQVLTAIPASGGVVISGFATALSK